MAVFRRVRDKSYRRLEPATLDVVMVLGIGTSWRLVSASKDLLACEAFTAGLALEPREIASNDAAACVEVRLPAPVARDLFRAPLSSTDPLTAGAALLGRHAGQLVDRVANATDPQRAATEVVHMMAARLSDGASPTKPEIRWAWRQIAENQGRVSVRTLAREIGWSERHFTARFHADIGMAPKATARVARFSSAHQRVTRSAEGLSRIAASAGYSDQSHMTREFRALAGATPAEVRSAAAVDIAIRDAPAQGPICSRPG